MNRLDLLDHLKALEDQRFDRVFPVEVSRLSGRFWTPVAVARIAANFLVDRPGCRVLDVGCGPGKFCLVGALWTEGHFTGAEQREGLAETGARIVRKARIANAQILHRNVLEMDFAHYDAFYFFNPFEENLISGGQIDRSVDFSADLFEQYSGYVLGELQRAPMGTRVATFWSQGEDLPVGYACEKSLFGNALQLWRKVA